MQSSGYHILILSSAHPADDVRVLGKEAVTLVNAGHRVELWGRHKQEEIYRGVAIHPLPQTNSRLRRMLYLPWWLFREAMRRDADFHHLHDSELLPMGIVLALLGKRVIYDVHEDLPGSILTRYWIPRPLRRLVAALAGLLEKTATMVLTGFVPATPAIARRFPAHRRQVVQNLPRLEEFADYTGIRMPSTEEAVFAYVGVLSEPRGAIQMLDALDLSPPHYRLVIMGVVAPADLFDRMTRHRAWPRVTYLGHRPRTEVMQLLMNAHAGLVLFHPEPNHVEAQPNKLFEYMAAGLPVIASDFPLWRDLVGGQACGRLVNPLDPAAITRAMTAIIDHPAEAAAMGTRGRAAVYERLNWSAEGVGLVRFYSQLALEDTLPII